MWASHLSVSMLTPGFLVSSKGNVDESMVLCDTWLILLRAPIDMEDVVDDEEDDGDVDVDVDDIGRGDKGRATCSLGRGSL